MAAMQATKRLAGVAPEVNLRECISHMPLAMLSANKAVHSLKPRGDVTKSPKQGYQWPHKKDLYPPKIFKKILCCFVQGGHILVKMKFPVFSLCYINLPCVIFMQKLTISSTNKGHMPTVLLHTEPYKVIS